MDTSLETILGSEKFVEIKRLMRTLPAEATIAISYDGSGDSGEITYTSIEGVDSSDVNTDPFENAAYEILEHFHGGWENDDGAHGTITFYAATKSFKIEHYERYTETNYYENDGEI